jgi:ABC-2 type transport system ATP-binding protein
MIKVSNLRKTFVSHRKEPGLKGSLQALFKREEVKKDALKSVSLEIQTGEIIGLIGANGAGKTTLVKILSGIIHPTSGEATVMGFRPWERANEYRRQMSLIMGQKAQVW